jgi:hypothetical protein
MSLRPAVAATSLLLLVSALAVPATLAVGGGRHEMTALPGEQVEVRAGQTFRDLRPVMAESRTSLMAEQSVTPTATADIEVSYDGFSQAAEDAFQAAVDVWETQIVSSQVIHVDAAWTPLPEGVLGSAGPETFYVFDGDDRAYPAALAEAICSCEGPDPVEIGASFNSDFDDWYLGTDGNPPSNEYDFMTVVLHELGHGLGFLSSFRLNNAETGGRWGLLSSAPYYGLNFDFEEWSASSGGVLLTSYSAFPATKALKQQLTDGSVYFGGANVVTANGGRAKLYAPNPWDGGSSNSHFDEVAFPAGTTNALMTPMLSNGEVIHMPGPLTLALFRDIGWTTADEVPSETDPPVVSAPVGTVGEGQKIGSTALLHLSWPDATDASGIASYQLQRKQGSGTFTDVTLPLATATAVDVALTPGASYQFQLRATDTEGNTSDWVTTPSGTLTLLQENAGSVVYAGSGWKRISLSGASGGKVKKTGNAGRTATLSFNGTSVAFVSTRSPARGIAEIWLDGEFQELVDLYRASISKRWIIWAPDAPLAAGAHTLEVHVTGLRNPSATKNRIDVDAFLTWP